MISSLRSPNHTINKSFYENGTRYRSVRYKISTSQNVVGQQARKTYFTKASSTNFYSTKPRKSYVGTSMTKIKRFPQQQQSLIPQEQKFQTSNCIQVFKEMINSQKNVKAMKCTKKQPRVYLPNLNDQNPSKFLTLDPIGWPINFIEKQIETLKQIIQKEKSIVKRTRQQIPIFQANQLKKLQQIKYQGNDAFKKLWNLLKTNKVIQQQAVLKAKKSIAQQKQFIAKYKQQFQSTNKRTLDLQDTIFSGRPFQLKQREQYQIISQKYF